MADESINKPTRRSERIGKYEILGHIATGGMGIIYKARDSQLDRIVALKILPPEMATQQTTLIRFEREAKAAAHLRHENIVTIFDVGESGGTHFIALEYIEGTDLQAYINRKCKLDPEEARQIVIQATRALCHAHEQGIVHRDIKPSNFLMTQKGNRIIVKLTDFGLAIRHENDAEFRITRDKTTVGTVDYMSPEQARDSRSADIRSDIYSLGCTFYHMLAGNAPFARGTMPERIVQHMQAPPPDVRRMNPNIPLAFMLIINRMLAKKPEDRYQAPADLLADLERPDQIVPTSRRAPVAGKLDEGGGRKPPMQPTVVIERKALNEADESDEAIENEPPPTRPIKVKKPAARPVVKPSVAPSSAEVEVQRAASETREMAVADEAEEDPPRDELAEDRPARKNAAGSPIWMYATAASVGVLGLVLVFALLFGGRAPVKPEEKKTETPPPIVKVEPPVEIDKPPPVPVRPAVDTSPARMGIGMLDLPIMDPLSARPDLVALRKEYFGPFTDFPQAPDDAKVVRLGRLAFGPDSVRSLAEAFALARADGVTVIEIQDNGPIFVPSLPALTQRSLVLRAGAGYRPLLVWDVPASASKPATALVTLSRGQLILDNLDLAVSWPGEQPAAWFDLPESDFFASACTFSAASKLGQPVALVRRKAGLTPTEKLPRTWLQHCYLRGADAMLLDGTGDGGEVMLEESLIAGNQQPLFQMRGRDNDRFDLYCVRSTLTTGPVLLRFEPLLGKTARPRISGHVLDSIVSRHDGAAAVGDMVQLLEAADPALLTWRSANTVYAGWKRLLSSSSKNIGGHDIGAWRLQMGEFGNAGTALSDNWPRGLSGLEEQPASVFLPGASPVSFAALTGSGAIGCIIGRLPPARESWREATTEQRKVPLVPLTDAFPAIEPAVDNLYHGERLDLNKIDLAEHLRMIQQTKPLAPRVVLVLDGKGACPCGPIQVKGIQQLVLYFNQPPNPRDAMWLELNAPAPLLRPPVIDFAGGKLELVGLHVRLSPATLVPTIVQVKSGDLSLTRCRLQGPLTASAENFHSLITVSNPDAPATTLLLRDNVFTSAKNLIQLDNNVQIKARNNIFLSLGDAVRFDINRPAAPMTHLFDHNTFAARNNCFTLKTGPAFQPTAAALMHGNSNAFLHPFADGDATLLRGGQAWVSSGRWTWQGRYNLYDTHLRSFVNGDVNARSSKQELSDWKAAWGQIAEDNPISYDPGKSAKPIPTDNLTQPALLMMLDRLALPENVRRAPNENPPGAIMSTFGIKKKG